MKGDKYARWTVVNNNKVFKNNKVYLNCKCECGTIRDIIIKNLKSGQSTSCGCLRRESNIKRNSTHGKRFTREWRIWQAMKNRCGNKNVIQYKNYGGRGIKVCEEWATDFMNFYNDMGVSPKGTSIDRIDNNGDYCKANCKWSTSKEQTRNKSNNRKINGICITDIDRKLGSKSGMVDRRLKRGWSVERAITTHANK